MTSRYIGFGFYRYSISSKSINLFRSGGRDAFSASSTTLKTTRSISSTKKNHYDVLGLTPKATQQDIKTAYFKLSKVYHPDVNKDNADSAQKFREVTEAYEVLGNVQLRKEYDVKSFNLQGEEAIFAPKQAGKKRQVYTGRSNIYNYDEWLKGHYSELFRRRDEIKQTQKLFEKRLEEERQIRIEVAFKLLFVCAALMVVLVVQYALHFDAKKASVVKKKKNENSH